MSSNAYKKPDFWTKKAFTEGYPARSVYKLKEMNEKFSLFSKHNRILDLGAAPGSWTVFVLRELANTGHAVAIDLKPLASNVTAKNLDFFCGNLYNADIWQGVKELGPYHAVLCDAAPDTTGNKTVDSTRSAELVEKAIDYAEHMLMPGGNCVIKIFQGNNQQAVMKKMKEVFTTARNFKPTACRSQSIETYLIGLNRK
ncbi:MAG: RlmE family RNA methyltransferase [Spirochaetales bacterium]